MAAVNEAYEVLINPELRARFDAGDDPMNPAAQAAIFSQAAPVATLRTVLPAGRKSCFEDRRLLLWITLRQERPSAEKFRDYGLEVLCALHAVEEAERFSRAGSTDSPKHVMGSISSSEEVAEVEGMGDILKGCRRVIVVGLHGWFPGAMMRTVLGEPTGTSGKFVNMMEQAIEEFATAHGSVVSTHLLNCLICDRHIRTVGNSAVVGGAESFPSAAGFSILPAPKPQRLQLSAATYFESTAAREPFEFQNTNSDISESYVTALENVLANGAKMVYVASPIPIYSGLFTAMSHPLILRALYIDGDAYHSSNFLSNLLVLVLRILNTNFSDSGLLAHLSEATAGSLNRVGYSTLYEELAAYSLAVKYLFLTNDGLADHSKLVVEPCNAMLEQNDYEIPWSLRDIIVDERVAHFSTNGSSRTQLSHCVVHQSPLKLSIEIGINPNFPRP
ncbi:hypothetical protein BDQ17DRAFT_1428716 [Cyathus striatus]|nr:hypothetical protein BDQ17DRAFT_1428716 [Cyathus striatus]